MAVGIGYVRHQRRGQAERRRRNDIDTVEPRRCRPCEIAEPRNTRQVLARAQAFGVAHSRRDHRVELIEPLRQFPVEKTAQFDRAEPASRNTPYAASASGKVKSRATAPARTRASTASCTVSAIPGSQSRHRNGSPTPMRTPVRSRAPACAINARRIDAGGIERGKAVGEIGDAARQKTRRVEREG